MLGQIAPCGCTAVPLGGLQHAFGYIEANSVAGQRLVLEPGSLLYPDPDHPEAPADAAGWAQAEQRAKTLHARFSALGPDLVSGFGPTDPLKVASIDAGQGPDGQISDRPLPRVLANAAAPIEGVARFRRHTLGRGVEVVVTAVAEEELSQAHGSYPALGEPVAAAKAALTEAGEAQLSVVIAIGSRNFAQELAEALDVDVVMMGGKSPNVKTQEQGEATAKVGNTYLIQPGERAQTLTHLTLRLDAKDPAKAAAGEWTLVDSTQVIEQRIEQLRERIAKFEADPSADPGFIAQNKAQLAELEKQLGATDPADPAVARFAQVPVNCHAPVDAEAKTALEAYDAWVAKEMKARFEGVRTPEPAKGQPSYAGREACADCHEEAVEQWQGTVHGRAYATLEKANKQFDLTCVGCHVTGFREAGGAEVVETRGLIDVQCEQCHGPGSAHVEDPSADNIEREVPESVCLGCHTPEHSDTFDYTAYLRDVLGPGHGAEAHAALGEGPTGAELRAAAVAAGGCKKM